MMPVPDLMPALPELFLAIAAMVLMMVGVFRADRTSTVVSWLAVLALIVDLVLINRGPLARTVTFNGMFVTEQFAIFMKSLIVIGSAASIVMARQYNERNRVDRFEFPILILFATIGMQAMVSANDLISLYIGLELQSLSLYVLAAFKRDTVRSTEAGLKYFVLGALSSGMLLYGASLIYGFAGSTNFDQLAKALSTEAGLGSIGLIIGVVFLSVGIAFKCSAVPFHMWTPDVYEGAPTPVTSFFAVAPKIAALSLFLRVMIEPFGHLVHQWQQIIWAISLASMVLGSYAAISQSNIKRLMAYSSIGHVGYALIGLAAGSAEGIRGVLIYMAVYLVMNLGAFSVILCMERKGESVEEIGDLAGLSKSQPLTAAALAIFMFSMAGVPPLAGFVPKFIIFMAAVHAGLIWLAVLGILASVVGCYYYIRVVKLMYFDAPAEELDPTAGGSAVRVVTALTAIIILLFILIPGPLLATAEAAAASLFQG
jgi:NADH-quinone oxidoreductase subunit N